jgi:hypothetical protein
MFSATRHDVATTAELRAAFEFLELSLHELWLGYFEVGGNRDQAYLGAYMNEDRTDIEPSDRDHIIDALNDTFVERGLDHPLTYGIA